MGAAMRTRKKRESPARERLLDAAAELFYKRGVNAVGIDEIIERAGVAKMSLYNHFDSKDALVVEYLRRRHEMWMAWFRGRVEAARSPRGRVLAVFDALREWFEEKTFRGCAFLNTSAELCDRKHPARAICTRHVDDVREYLRTLAEDAGLAQPSAVADRLLVLVHGAILGALVAGTSEPARWAREAAESVISGL